MRILTPEQKEQLALHIAKKPIDYIELYNELYDHYASAYEKGDESFEEVIEQLDDHFHYQRIKSINANLLKKTKKSVNEIYWTEFKNFWRWPQIVTTLIVLFLGFMLIEFFPIKSIMWFVIIPLLIFNVSLIVYSLILKQRNKYGNKRFESAHLASTHHFFRLPITLFNLTIFLPAFFLEPYQVRTAFYANHPLIPFILMMVFFIAAYIGFKVFRTKIKVQYL